jgi:hypothetical protein
MPLEIEKQRFNELQPTLMPQFAGHIAVIHGNELVGVYPTIEEAYSDAVKKLGLQSVLIRKIGESEQVASIPALALGVLRANNPHSTSR